MSQLYMPGTFVLIDDVLSERGLILCVLDTKFYPCESNSCFPAIVVQTADRKNTVGEIRCDWARSMFHPIKAKFEL